MPTLKSSRPVDSLLSDLAVEFANEEDSFIGGRVCPSVPVDEESGTYYTFSLDSFYGSASEINLRRAPGSRSVRGGWDLGSGTYRCEEYSYEDVIDRRIKKGLNKFFSAEAKSTKSATHKLLIAQEKRVRDLLMTAANWTNSLDLTGNAARQWNTAGTSTPVADIDTAVKKVLEQGRRPNTLVLGWDTWIALRKNADIIALFALSDRKAITKALIGSVLKDMFGIENVHVADSLRNTAVAGQTASLAQTWRADAWVGYVNPEPSTEDPSALYQFTFDGLGVNPYDDRPIKSDITEAAHIVDEAVVAAGLGYPIVAAVT